MSTAPFLLSRPVYAITNIVSTSIRTKGPEEEILVAIVEFLIPVTILLDNYVEQIYNGEARWVERRVLS